MYKGPDLAESDLDLLSEREKQILALAVEGCTDEQISRFLGITTSTVNSYWVRIRSKVGFLSRTEIVGGYLRHLAKNGKATLEAEIGRLSEKINHLQSQSTASSQTGQDSTFSWPFGALDAAPIALFVAQPPGTIIFANREASDRLGSESSSLVGTYLDGLLAPGQPLVRDAIDAFFAEAEPRRLILGAGEPMYCASMSGETCRVIWTMEGFVSSDGFRSVVTVRPFFEDAESVIRELGRM